MTNTMEPIVPFIGLDRDAGPPLQRQLYEQLRQAILNGRLASGTRLPPTRELARQLGVSRNTVLNAFAQLLAEGYVEGRVGSGTYVAGTLPDQLLAIARPLTTPDTPTGPQRLSRRGRLLASTRVTIEDGPARPRPFVPGIPDLRQLPFDAWSRIALRHMREPSPELLTYGSPAGYEPLRQAIATRLGGTRGVVCTPRQVIVVSGSQQALAIAASVLLDPGDEVWMEDPGYGGARGALIAAGATLVPTPVDQDGLDVAWARGRAPRARLACVTPSCQYPLGSTMSLARRLQLLEWAGAANAWILEDDYNSEYRYAGRPLAALQGLDHHQRVIYVGTFSKVVFPALRVGYLVVPPDMVDAFQSARALIDRHPPWLEQAVLTDFIGEGHLDRHVRRMRSLYASRQAALVDACRVELAGLLDVAPRDTGMHLIGWLPAVIDDREAARAAREAGVVAWPLSAYALEHRQPGGLLLGYAACDEDEIRSGIRQLAPALRQLG